MCEYVIRTIFYMQMNYKLASRLDSNLSLGSKKSQNQDFLPFALKKCQILMIRSKDVKMQMKVEAGGGKIVLSDGREYNFSFQEDNASDSRGAVEVISSGSSLFTSLGKDYIVLMLGRG